MTDNSLTPLLEMRSVKKAFAGVSVLHGVDLDLRSGEVHALAGQNGAGKSTLMKILSGVYAPDGGQVLIEGRPVEIDTPRAAREHGISMVFQEFSLVPTLSVAANVVLGAEPTRAAFTNEREILRRACAALDRLGLDIPLHATVGELSVGERQLVEIAKALVHEPRVLVLDEPTASLASQEISTLFAAVRGLVSQGIGVIYISHHLEEILEVCDRVTVLRDGRLIRTAPIADVDVKAIIEAMLGEELEALKDDSAVTSSEHVVALQVDGLVSSPRLHGVSFSVREGEIVGLAGLLGSGRTETLEVVAGLRALDGGSMCVFGKRYHPRSPAAAMRSGVALVPEDRRMEGVIAGQSVRDNVLVAIWKRLSRLRWISTRRSAGVYDGLAQRLSIMASSPRQAIETLSGGNQQKAVVARAMSVQPRILLLDEPTAGIDVRAKRQIIEEMRAFAVAGGSVVVVSSDLQEVVDLCDRVVLLSKGVSVSELSNQRDGHRLSEAQLLRAIQSTTAAEAA